MEFEDRDDVTMSEMVEAFAELESEVRRIGFEVEFLFRHAGLTKEKLVKYKKAFPKDGENPYFVHESFTGESLLKDPKERQMAKERMKACLDKFNADLKPEI